MSADLLERIERDLDKMGEELWSIDGPDDVLDKVLQKVSLLKGQIGVQKSLQATANLIRGQPNDKALPKQQATKVKHFIRFVFRKESRGGGRHKQLRGLHCDALKFLGLSYTTEEIVKMDDVEFEILQTRGEEFFHCRELSRLLYRPDVDKAVDARFADPDEDGSYEKFIQDHTAIRLQMRKRKYDDIESDGASADNQAALCDKAEPGQASTGEKATTNTYVGDAFIVMKDDARYALSLDEHVGEIWLTNPEKKYNAYDRKKRSFLTLWVSEAMGEELGRRSKPMVVS